MKIVIARVKEKGSKSSAQPSFPPSASCRRADTAGTMQDQDPQPGETMDADEAGFDAVLDSTTWSQRGESRLPQSRL